MASERISLYHQVLTDRSRNYNAAIDSRQNDPFIYPWDTISALLLFLAVLFLPRLSSNLRLASSLLVFVLIAYLCYGTMTTIKCLNFAGGYGPGLVCAWGMIMTVALVLVHNPATDFQRLETRAIDGTDQKISHRDNQQVNGSTTTSRDAGMNGNANVKQRKVWGLNGPASKQASPDEKAVTAPYNLVWQSYPTSMTHRIDWVVDLMTSFRGLNWNWRITSVPKIDVALPENTVNADNPTSPPTTPPRLNQSTLHALNRQALVDFVTQYLLLDLLATVMKTDPYLLGIAPIHSPSPWPWLCTLTQTIPIATRLTRLLLSLAGVLTALSFIFSLAPLSFNFLIPRLIPHSTLTRLTRSPLLEPWMYPPYNSSVTTSILDRGLPGFWGLYWHQLFRFGISQPSIPIINALHLSPKSTVGKFIQVMTGFTLSGLIHFSASYTSFQPSRPFTPFIFFVLQGLAVMVQSTFSRSFSAHISDTRTWPRYVRRTLNGIIVLVWLYNTGPLLSDDFARCGVWLFEPVPISILRGLGFGPGGEGEGWWCWGLRGQRFVGWRDDERWWRRGIAFY